LVARRGRRWGTERGEVIVGQEEGLRRWNSAMIEKTKVAKRSARELTLQI
jgi:hypothetical protein